MNGDDIGMLEEFIQWHHGNAHLLGPLFSQIGIVGHHTHADSLRKFREMAADLPRANNAEYLIVEFDSHELVFFPLTCLHGRGGLGNTPAHGADHRHRMLGSRHGIAARRVHHHDPATGRCRRIDIVQA